MPSTIIPDDAGMESSLDNLDKLRYSDGDLSTAEIRNTMQDAQEHAAMYRTSETLSEGKVKIDEVM